MLSGIWSSILNDIPAKFNYNIDKSKPLNLTSSLSIFQLYEGKHKTTNSLVLIHHVNPSTKKDKDSQIYLTAAVKNAKTLRHPAFLAVHNVEETNKGIYIATEYATPLINYLSTPNGIKFTFDSLSWNILQLLECLNFIHLKARLVHGLISPCSIFVTSTGLFKFGPVEADLNIGCTVNEVFSYLETHPGRKIYDKKSFYFLNNKYLSLDGTSPAQLIDKYNIEGLISYIYHVYKSNQSGPIDIKSVSWNQEEFYKNCAIEESDKKMGFSDLKIEFCDDYEEQINYFKNSDLVKIMRFLTTYAIRGDWDREKFFTSKFHTYVNELASSVKLRMILPFMKVIFDDKNSTPTFKNEIYKCYCYLLCDYDPNNYIADDYDRIVFDTHIWPILLNLTKEEEISLRFMILQNMNHLESIILERHILKIYDKILEGLVDNSAEIRDMTLRSLVYLLPKITFNQSYHSSKTLTNINKIVQKDTCDQVRTNAVICLLKLINCFEKSEKLIANTFLYGLKDPFPPCRLVCLKGVHQIISQYTFEELCNKVLPLVGPRLADSDVKCTATAYEIIHVILSKVNVKPFTQNFLRSTSFSNANFNKTDGSEILTDSYQDNSKNNFETDNISNSSSDTNKKLVHKDTLADAIEKKNQPAIKKNIRNLKYK